MSSPTRRAKARRPSISSSRVDSRAPRARRLLDPSRCRRGHVGSYWLRAGCRHVGRDRRSPGHSMLTLRSSPASPFGRKIRIAASLLGLDREITIEPADTGNPSDSVRQQNPLGKIPALVLEDGMVLFDSRVILEYLDYRAGGGRIVPSDAAARFAALRLQALADGLMDASILLIYEGRWRP